MARTVVGGHLGQAQDNLATPLDAEANAEANAQARTADDAQAHSQARAHAEVTTAKLPQAVVLAATQGPAAQPDVQSTPHQHTANANGPRARPPHSQHVASTDHGRLWLASAACRIGRCRTSGVQWNPYPQSSDLRRRSPRASADGGRHRPAVTGGPQAWNGTQAYGCTAGL